MVPLARRNLLSEKARFAVSVGGVAFAVLLILIVVSLYRGWSDVGRLYTQLPGDVWVSQEGTADPFHSTSFLPARKGAALARIAGVRAVIPAYGRHIAFRHDGHELDVYVLALDVPAGLRVAAETRARYLPPPGEINIDRVLAAEAGVGAGDPLPVLGRPLAVGHVHSGGTQLFETAFLNAADARALFGLPDRVSYFLLELAPGADLQRVSAAVAAAVPGSETHTSQDFATRFGRRVSEGFLAVVGVLMAIGFLVGGAVIALTTYTATVERAREFGVLKAMGASFGFLFRVVLQQSLIVGSLGSALGVVAAAVAADRIRTAVPEFVTDLRLADVAIVLGVALGMSALAAWAPLRRIARIDPASVFRA